MFLFIWEVYKHLDFNLWLRGTDLKVIETSKTTIFSLFNYLYKTYYQNFFYLWILFWFEHADFCMYAIHKRVSFSTVATIMKGIDGFIIPSFVLY